MSTTIAQPNAALVPLPHQVEDSDALPTFETGYLWADAGTGKTLTAIEAARKGRFSRGVVLCPKLALSMWAEEFHKQLEYRPVVLRTGKIPPRRIHPLGADVLITTFDLAAKHASLIRDYTNQSGDSFLVLDEAHLLKTPTARRTQAVFGPGCSRTPDSIVTNFESTWQLTGTPMTRYPDDLWSQLHVGRSDILADYNARSYGQFVRRFCTTELRKYSTFRPAHTVVTGAKNMKKLNELLVDCEIVRRTRDEVLADLPPVTHRRVELGYRDVPATSVPMDPAIIAKALADKDSQLSKTRRILGIAKVADSVKYLQEYGDQPMLIGFWHRDVGASLTRGLREAGIHAEQVDGSTSHNERDRLQRMFNAGELPALVGQIKAMGVSWNLQKCCRYVYIAEAIGSSKDLEQFIARVVRRGVDSHVQVDHGVTTHNVDEALAWLRASKENIAEGLGL